MAHAQSYVGLGVLQGLGAASLSAGVASSHDAETSGWLARLGADFTRDRFSLALRTNIQSPGYLPVGDVAYLEALRQRTLASAGVDLGRLGWVSLASATQIYLAATRREGLVDRILTRTKARLWRTITPLLRSIDQRSGK